MVPQKSNGQYLHKLSRAFGQKSLILRPHPATRKKRIFRSQPSHDNRESDIFCRFFQMLSNFCKNSVYAARPFME